MLEPRGPRYLVKRMDPPKKESTLIVLVETPDSESSQHALVLARGTKCFENVQVADTVILKKYVGTPVEVDFDGELLEALIVMEEDILGVFVE